MIPTTPFGQESQSQFQPVIATSSRDCVPCSTRKGIRRTTLDRTYPTTAAIRAKSGAPSTRGLTYGEASQAALAFGVKADPVYGNTRQEMFDLIDAGHSACLSIDCSATVNTERRTNSYTGDHTVYVHDVRHVGDKCLCERHTTTAHNEYLIEDPGNSSIGYVWWSAALVYKAGELRTTDRMGQSHGINLLVFPDTEGVKWRVTVQTALRKEPRIDSPRLKRLPAGTIIPGGRTERGGAFRRSDGSQGYGWVHLHYGGVWGWAQGGKVNRA